MEKREMWGVRVRAWRASGVSMSEFTRGKEFTAAGLSYWVRRLSEEPIAATKSVKLARVVRKDVAAQTARASVDAVRMSPLRLVIEAGALRVHVCDELDGVKLEALLIAVSRAASAVGA